MPTDLRIGTFNVENLFSRVRMFDHYDHSVGDRKLQALAGLERELGRATYDKPEILRLYGILQDYIKINAVRGKLFRGSGSRRRVVPAGMAGWDGFIEFKRAQFTDVTRRNTGRVIRAVNADVMCIIEAEDRPTLQRFDSDVLGRLYEYNMLVDGNDQRGIDVGVYSKLPLEGLWTHIHDGTRRSRIFSRDCPEIEILLPDGETLWLLINHLKSKSGPNQRYNDTRRRRQAERVAEILEWYDLRRDLVVVAGDLNDTPDSRPLEPLRGIADLHDVLELQYPDDPDARWTYHYRTNEQIDYLLVSEPLRNAFVRAGVERRGIHRVDRYTNGATRPFSTMKSWRDAASDHGAVWADFRL